MVIRSVKLLKLNDFLSDAGDRCGVFIATSILFNSILISERFDVLSIVRELRESRENMISSIVIFKFTFK